MITVGSVKFKIIHQPTWGSYLAQGTTSMGELFNTRVLQINLKLIMAIETQWFPKGADSLDQLRRSHVIFILSKKCPPRIQS